MATEKPPAAPRRFAKGDVCAMTVGGPLMAVERAAEGEDVYCVWFEPDGVLNRSRFHPSALRKYVEVVA